jgi:hypothetical protein
MGAWIATPTLSGLLAAVAGACMVLLIGGWPGRVQAEELEYAVKATYLHKFAPFVEWPEYLDEAAPGTFDLCIVGNDPFGGLIDRAVGGLAVGERPFAVRRFRTAVRDAGCRIMYIASSGPQAPADALDAVRGLPVLTVTDSARNARSKGIVNFMIREGRVRFEIDNDAAAENGIAVSSKLLDLAISVRDQD